MAAEYEGRVGAPLDYRNPVSLPVRRVGAVCGFEYLFHSDVPVTNGIKFESARGEGWKPNLVRWDPPDFAVPEYNDGVASSFAILQNFAGFSPSDSFDVGRFSYQEFEAFRLSRFHLGIRVAHVSGSPALPAIEAQKDRIHKDVPAKWEDQGKRLDMYALCV